MAVNFPDSPSNGDTTVINGATYTWDGVKWDTTSFASNVTATYDSPLNLPTTGLTNGDVAWVGGSTNKLYISNGTGWLSATLTNSAPVINSVQDASAGTTPFSLATDGTPTVITIDATDPESFGLTYSYSVTSGALGTTATVSQADNVFTITPGTNDPADVGTFELTFSVYDGVNTVTSVNEFTLAFLTPWYGDRGIFWGGNYTDQNNGSQLGFQIEYVSISSPSNSVTFGNLATSGYTDSGQSLSDSVYGVLPIRANLDTTSIQYITVSLLGNAQDFGDLTGSHSLSSTASNGIHGLIAGGYSYDTSSPINTIDYITIATPGNAASFGTLTLTKSGAGGVTDGTLGLFGGGYDNATSAHTTNIDYVTIGTSGTATSGPTLSTAVGNMATCDDGTYGLWMGGNSSGKISTIQYLTIATSGTSSTFGNLTEARYYQQGCSDATYGLCAGGFFGSAFAGSKWDIIDYVTIATPSNAIDFGDLSQGVENPSSCSGNSA